MKMWLLQHPQVLRIFYCTDFHTNINLHGFATSKNLAKKESYVKIMVGGSLVVIKQLIDGWPRQYQSIWKSKSEPFLWMSPQDLLYKNKPCLQFSSQIRLYEKVDKKFSWLNVRVLYLRMFWNTSSRYQNIRQSLRNLITDETRKCFLFFEVSIFEG